MVCIELCSTRTMGRSARSGMVVSVRRSCAGDGAVVRWWVMVMVI